MGVVAMSYRSNWSDCEAVIRCINDMVRNSSFTGCEAQVESITQTLRSHLHVGYRQLQIERENSVIHMSEVAKTAAEERIEELLRGDA